MYACTSLFTPSLPYFVLHFVGIIVVVLHTSLIPVLCLGYVWMSWTKKHPLVNVSPCRTTISTASAHDTHANITLLPVDYLHNKIAMICEKRPEDVLALFSGIVINEIRYQDVPRLRPKAAGTGFSPLWNIQLDEWMSSNVMHFLSLSHCLNLLISRCKSLYRGAHIYVSNLFSLMFTDFDHVLWAAGKAVGAFCGLWAASWWWPLTYRVLVQTGLFEEGGGRCV